MKLSTDTNPALVASKDPTRYVLQHVLFTDELAVATNGRMIVALCHEPDDLDGSDELPALVPMKAVTAACAKKRGKLFVQKLHVADGKAILRGMDEEQSFKLTHDLPADKFPNFTKVFPAEAAHTLRIGINPRLLMDLAKAMGATGKREGVTLHIDPANRCGGMYVTASYDSEGEAVGVLMPMRSPDSPLEKNRALKRVRIHETKNPPETTTTTPTE
jgi:hypothetical protein